MNVPQALEELKQINSFIETGKWPYEIPIAPSTDPDIKQFLVNRLLQIANTLVNPTDFSPQRMSVKEFRELGFLQEVNRKFLHPLGLALDVVVLDNGSEMISGIWDYRKDLDGIQYPLGFLSAEKAQYVEDAFQRKALTRQELLGYVIQPIL